MSMSTPSSEMAGDPPPARQVGGTPSAPKPVVPKQVTCPVCATPFDPRGTEGRCPVCGEQVVPAEEAARTVPVLSPASRWLFREGNWRLTAVMVLVVYQIVLFIVLWIHLAQVHAL
ncbi:MAG: hypothetical protein PVSMB4_11330 [Ktedonobacterales bacterium]